METPESSKIRTDLASKGKLLKLLPEMYTVLQCPLEYLPRISQNAAKLPFFSLTVTPEELSVIAPESSLPDLFGEDGLQQLKNVEGSWKCFKVVGPLEFSLVGVLHAILDPLKSAKISVLAVGTYDTDYFLVKAGSAEQAVRVLSKHGFTVDLL